MRRCPFAAIVILLAWSVTAWAAPTVAIDWPSFLGRHDLRWNRLPPTWDRGAFIGNGLVGAMIHAEGERALVWQLGRTDVIDHRESVEPMAGKARLPIGWLRLEPVGKIRGGTQTLALWDAEASTEIETDRGRLRVRSFVAEDDPVLVVELEATAGERDATLRFRPALAVNPRNVFRGVRLGKEDLNPAPWVEEHGPVRVSVQRLRAGGAYAVAWRERPGTRRTLYLAITTSFPDTDADAMARAALSRAERAGVPALRAAHRRFWHAYYPQSFVSLPDTRLEAFYWLQMYKLAAATRADRPVIDLLGPWFHDTPWPGLWWNLNVQLTHWPVYAANRLGIGESLLRLFNRCREQLRRNAGDAGGSHGAAIGRTSSYDCVSPVTDTDGVGKPEPNRPHELGNLLWATHLSWLHHRHTMDDRHLRERLLPLLRDAVTFMLTQLREGKDQRLHFPVAVSPEYPTPAADTNYDLALVRWGCGALADAEARLAVTSETGERCRRAMPKLAPYPQGEDGFWIGAGVPLAESHRHFSHLLMVYPLRTFSPESATNRALIERSLAHWIGLPGGLQGYSYVGASAISSLLGKGDDAARYLDELVRKYVKRNTMYLEAGPVIETPLAGAQAVHEMLIQNTGGVVRVFPAVPRSWQDVTFDRLLAEGAFVVSAVRRGGRTKLVVVESLAGEPLGLAVPDAETLVRTDGGPAPVRAPTGELRVELARGARLVLETPDASAADRTIAPVRADERHLHAFGARAAAPGPTRIAASSPVPGDDRAPNLDAEGFVRRWVLLGPFENEYGLNGWEEIAWEQVPGEAQLAPRIGDEVRIGDARVRWVSHAAARPELDLTAAFGAPHGDDRTAYAVAYVQAPREIRNAQLALGSSDQAKVYLNGALVWLASEARGLRRDQDRVPVVLRAGTNVLVVKVANERGRWGATARFVDERGTPIEGLR